MKDVITRLIKEFYESDIIIRDITITENANGKVMNVFPNLASIKWNLFKSGTTDSRTGIGMPDIEKTEQIINKRKTTKAQQIMKISQTILKQRNKTNDWNSIYGSPPPKINDDPNVIMDYCLGALFYLEVVTPYEYDVSEPLFDEEGLLLGNKMLPKKQDIDEEHQI